MLLIGNLKAARCITIASIVIFCIAACNNPDAEKKQREDQMQKFVIGVVQHIFDRDPDTIQEAMNTLAHTEMTETMFEKLQSQSLLPETDISILKIVDESKTKHLSNQVTVDSATPIDPITKNDVRFKVDGKITDLKDGKPVKDQHFECIVTCELTPEMSGYPRAVDVVMVSPAPVKATDKKPAPKKRRKS
jgi:hypothetical protein